MLPKLSEGFSAQEGVLDVEGLVELDARNSELAFATTWRWPGNAYARLGRSASATLLSPQALDVPRAPLSAAVSDSERPYACNEDSEQR